MGEGLLSIGQFSAQCRLSPKALRLYDDLGLVVPVRIDPASGYRWYAPGQAARARMVGLLRQLDMPLAQIAAVIDAPGEAAAAAVRAHVAAAQRAVRDCAELAEYVCLLLDRRDRSDAMPDNYEVQVRTVPARAVVSGMRRAHAADLGPVLGDLLGRMRAAGPGRPGLAGCPYTVYYAEVSQDSDGPVEIVRPMADLAAAQAAAARLGDVQARTEPEHEEAFVRMTLAQARGGRAAAEILDVLQRYVAASGRRASPPPRQVMIADWRTAGPDEPACDFAIPLHPAGPGAAAPG
ncbi:MAG TPA: MerR family transcriptional regulator [Streptosporangiaceae bacterium]|jgi:DNA-binding transcriptional MerR regulator